MLQRTKDGKLREWDGMTLDRMLAAYQREVQAGPGRTSEKVAADADATMLVRALKEEVVKTA